MLSAIIRVVARSAAIQLEEVAALSAASAAHGQRHAQDKGKGREVDPHLDQSDSFRVQSLSEILEQHESQLPSSPPTSSSSSSRQPTRTTKLSPLDRLIQQAPHSPPPPAPDTHPDRHIEAEKRKKKGLPPAPTSSPSSSSKQIPYKQKTTSGKPNKTPSSDSIGSSLNDLIRASPHTNPPPAPDTHPDRHVEAEQSRKRKILASSVQPIPPFKSSTVIEQVEQGRPTVSQNVAPQTSSSSPLDDLIKASARSPPASAPSSAEETIPKPHLEASQIAKDPSSGLDPAAAALEQKAEEQIYSSSNSEQEVSGELKPETIPKSTDFQEVTAKTPIDTVDGIEDLGPDPTTLKSQLDDDETPVVLRASKVPSSRLGRLFHYGSLAASLSIGAASESIRRTTGGNKSSGSVFMSDANIRRLVATLGRMRGAALKLGQFMSIQDNHMLPPEIEKVLHQVQAHANYMPDWQMERVMREEFGPDWQSLFSSFDRTPIASASIGQVHRATLSSDGTSVAVKIQFPGVASSIESDLNNLSLLLRSSALLPKGLYLQNTIAVMRRELQDECDYVKEAAAGRKFSELLQNDNYFAVPKVVEEATTGKVLTTEWMDGKPLSRVKGLSQEARDRIGTNILRLCLMELFQFRFMQTDPNWANFLYTNTNQNGAIEGVTEGIQLIDFGASREYTKEFMDGWYRLLKSCLENDRVKMKEESLSLGYLTGEENDVMIEAHLDSMALVASPFSHEGKYAFANQTITDSIRALIPIMLKHRLTPPPQETYSLNRKLSGAFLMCAKLGANVDCKKLWEDVVGGYKEG